MTFFAAADESVAKEVWRLFTKKQGLDIRLSVTLGKIEAAKKSVQVDYMIDKKLDRPLRDFVPLVAVGEDILWAVGLGISEDAKVKDDAKAVRLTCRTLS